MGSRHTLLGIVLLTACSANVVVDDAEGGHSGNAGAPGTGAFTGNGGDSADPRAAVIQSCVDYCATGCVSSPGCADACVTYWGDLLAECADEALSLNECVMPKTPNDCPDASLECEHELYDLLHCQNLYFCGTHAENECLENQTGSCDCKSNCDQGHTGEANCTLSADGAMESCDCFFDGAAVGHCDDPSPNPCYAQASCCAPLWR